MRINQEEFIAFDLETTGLHPVFDRIIEIGAVRFRGDGNVLGNFQQLIDPRCAISAGAMAVNGISDEMVAGQPLIEEVLPVFAEFIGESPVVMMAHNAGFDMGFLSVAYSRLGMQKPLHPVIDTVALARRRLALPNYRMETVGRYLQLVDQSRHRALEDSLLLKDIFLSLVRMNPQIKGVAELLQILPGLSFKEYDAVLEEAPSGFEALWEAIYNGRDVEILYLGGSNPGRTRVVTPLGVTQMGGLIYLSAFCHKSRLNKTYRLDRIASYRMIR
ncbi:MAG: exonuclease domain-containing protein [Bacillota bacterium]|nr:exonuclease domain-containing protein [Bacillota bacterium]